MRQTAGLFIRELALEAGVSKTTVQRTERGKNNLTLSTAVKLAQVFGVSPGILIIRKKPSGMGELADKIITARLLLGLKQKEFASLIGVNPSSIRDWELGKREMTERCYRLLQEPFNLIQSLLSNHFFW